MKGQVCHNIEKGGWVGDASKPKQGKVWVSKTKNAEKNLRIKQKTIKASLLHVFEDHKRNLVYAESELKFCYVPQQFVPKTIFQIKKKVWYHEPQFQNPMDNKWNKGNSLWGKKSRINPSLLKLKWMWKQGWRQE